MSKVNDYNEKCLDEIFTEKDAQEEQRQKEYDLMKEQLEEANYVLEVIAYTSEDIDTYALEQSFRRQAKTYLNKYKVTDDK